MNHSLVKLLTIESCALGQGPSTDLRIALTKMQFKNSKLKSCMCVFLVWGKALRGYKGNTFTLAV